MSKTDEGEFVFENPRYLFIRYWNWSSVIMDHKETLPDTVGLLLRTRIGFRHPEKEASFTSLKEGQRFHPAESGFSP